MNEEEVLNLLANKLSIVVKTEDVYNGGITDSSSLYTESKTIQLWLDGSLISEDYL